MRTYLLCLPIEPVNVAQYYERLPLHCTLLQYFEVGDRTVGLLQRLEAGFKNMDTLVLYPTGRDMFGHNLDVPVTLLQMTPQLLSLHRTAVEEVTSLNDTKILDPQWAGDGYRPHVSDVGGKSFAEAAGGVSVSEIVLIQKKGSSKYGLTSFPLNPSKRV